MKAGATKNNQLQFERLSEKFDAMDHEAVEQMKQNLRDSYMHMRDLNARCLIDMENTEKNDKRVFYFKPESVLLKDVDTQKLYREELIKTISEPPKLADQTNLAEQLTEDVRSQIQDMSEPDSVRVFLADYYQRRTYNLQHKKYKVLLRWAHFGLTSEYLERMGHHGTFTYGRLQFELENAIKRYERLSQDDDYGSLRDGKIKKPKAKGAATAEGLEDEFNNQLFRESGRKASNMLLNILQDPLSCLRIDDFEIFLRTQTYELKLFRPIEKYVARLKYLPIAKNLDIFKEAQVLIQNQRKLAHQESQAQEKMVRQRFDQCGLRKTDDLIISFEELMSSSFESNVQSKESFTRHVPLRISNLMHLQSDILQRASAFNIHGDIEIDEGHSFTYQVRVFFSLYFQKQIIKSRFSVYDQTVRDMKDAYEANEPPDDDIGDINEIERRNLNSLLLIDFKMVDMMNSNSDHNNIFLLKKGKKLLDHIHELKANFSDMTVVRLKKAYWLGCVMLKPKVSARELKQNTILSHDYSPDLLLQSLIDFVDTHDIATVNTVYHDLTLMQASLSAKQQDQLDVKQLCDQIDKIFTMSQISETDALKLLKQFGEALKSRLKENNFKRANSSSSQIKDKELKMSHTILKVMPQHYLECHSILRHMKIRDTKNKLLYTLNFFRAVQKRLALDLQEFAGREVVAQGIDLKAPQEATYIGSKSKMIGNNLFFKNMNNLKEEDQEMIKSSRRSRDSLQEEEKPKNHVVDLKQWKAKSGKYNELMLTTCPIMPPFHSKHGEPLEDKMLNPDNQNSENVSNEHITNRSSHLLTRMDTFKIDNQTGEILVIDDYGMHVMFDCSLEDSVKLDHHLLMIATYYVRKTESNFDFSMNQFPFCDRIQVLEDLYDCEQRYQFAKSKLLMSYLDSFEHICDPLEQRRLMQIMTDLMAQRPRLDTTAIYFKDSYEAEIQCMNTLTELIREVSSYLMSNEKRLNKSIKDYLQLTYKVLNEYTNKKWTDVKPEELSKEVKQRQTVQGGLRYQDVLGNHQESAKEDPTPRSISNKDDQKSEDPDQFAEMLGLKDMSVERVMQNAKDDILVEDMMAQDANFVKTQEGYPFFLKDSLINQGNNDSLTRVKFTDISTEVGVLDFYESMTSIPKVCSALTIIFEEVIEEFNPSNNRDLVAVHTIFIEKAYVEFKKTVAFCEEDLIEYQGSNFLENDMIMSSPDKLMFLIKDMIAHLSTGFKRTLNPFLVSKLDLTTVTHFQFPEIAKLTMMGSTQTKLDVNFSRNFIETQLQSSAAPQARFFPKLREDDRRVNVPPMLLVFCNLLEVLRLRESLVVALSESSALQDIFNELKELANKSNLRTMSQLPLPYQPVDGFTRDHINFFDDGSLSSKDIDLAINEFDPTLRSNINFMNCESLQCLVLDSGVQELRAVLDYQLMQKQLLLVTVKANSLMMNKHRRAQTEIDLFHEYRIKVSNPILDYEKLHKPGHAPGVVVVCQDSVQAAKSKIAHQTASYAEHLFIPLMPIKEALRGRIEKKQKEMLAQLSQVQVTVNQASGKDTQIYASLQPQTIAKLNKDYRIALVHCYCTQICKLNLLNALRVSTIEQSSRVKLLMNIFPPSQTIFHIQANEPKDYLQFHSHFANAPDNAIVDKPIFEQFEQGELTSISLIPSTRSLFQMEPLTYEDKPVFEKSIFDQVSGLDFNLKHLKNNKLEKYSSRAHLRGLLQSLDTYQGAGLEQALSNTQISRVFKFQHSLREIIEHKFFYAKLSMRPIEALQLETAALVGESYWAIGDEEEGEMMMRMIGEDKKLSDIILKKLVDERRRKQQLQDELADFGKEVHMLIQSAESHAPTLGIVRVNQYLERHRDYLHLKLIGGLFNTIESLFAKKRSVQCIQSLMTSLNTLTRIQLDVPFFENNFLTLHSFALDASYRSLESKVKHDSQTFNRSVQGLKLEKELVDSSYLLVSDIFAYPSKSSSLHLSNYCGQSYLFAQQQGLSSLLFGLDTQETSYLSTIYNQLEQNSRDYTVLDTTRVIKSDLSFEGLNKKVSYASDLATSKMLYFSLIILLNSRSIPHDANTFHAIMLPSYKRQIGWKVENEYQKKLGASMIKYKKTSKQLPQQQQVFDPKINRAAMSHIETSMQKEFHDRNSTTTTEATTLIPKRQPDKEIQFQQVKQGRMMMKAVIKVSQREVDARLMKMGYDACSKQVSALSKTLEMGSARLDNSIGNWQLFASTLTDFNPKRQQHLDPLNKISFLQLFLTRMKNRGMEIETLTSGPGVVFTYKDLNECLQTLCTQIMSQSEKEMRTRTQSLSEQINHLRNLTYIKDCRIDSLKSKVAMMQDNIARSVNSKIYEKGNALIFELDRGLREVRFYKEHIHSFEKEMMEIVRVDFRKSLMDKDLQIDSRKKEAYDNLNKLIADFKLLSSKQEVDSLDKIKAVQKWAKFEDESYLHTKSPGMMGQARASVQQQQHLQLQEKITSANDEGEERMRLQLITTQEEVIRLQKLIKEQRSLWMLKNQTLKLKYEDELEILKKKLTSNQALWEQLEESDKRTKILQQELIFTQKSLTQCEKIIEKLKDELKMSEHERIRLAQYRQNKGQRLQELEEQVKKMDVSDHININKVVDQLRTKDKQLQYLQNIEKSHNAQMQKTYEIQAKKDQVWRKKLDQEVELKRQALHKLNELQDEIKAVNVGGQSDLAGGDLAPNWKLKCKELYDICKGLAEENQSLLLRFKDFQNTSQIDSFSDNMTPLRSELNLYKEGNITQKTSGLSKSIGKTRNHRKDLLPLSVKLQDQSLDNGRDSNMFLDPSGSLYSQGFLLPNIQGSRLGNLSMLEHHHNLQETSGALSHPNRSKSQLEPEKQGRGNAASQKDIHEDDSPVGELSKNSEFLDLSLNHAGEISLGNNRVGNQEAMSQYQAYQAQSPLLIPIKPIVPIPGNQYSGRRPSNQYGFSVTKSTSQGDLFVPNPSQPTIPSTASNLDAYGLSQHALHSRAKIQKLHPQAYSSNIQSSERLPLSNLGGAAHGKSPIMMMRHPSNQRQQQQYQDSIRTEWGAAIGHSNMLNSTFHHHQRRDTERPLIDNQEQTLDPYTQSEQHSGLRLNGSKIVTQKKSS